MPNQECEFDDETQPADYSNPVFDVKRFPGPFRVQLHARLHGIHLQDGDDELFRASDRFHAEYTERAELKVRERKREYRGREIYRELDQLALDLENHRIIDFVREAVGRHIQLDEVKNPEQAIGLLQEELRAIILESRQDQERKDIFIAQDTRYWEERIRETFRTERPSTKDPFALLKWVFAKDGRARAQAFSEMMAGVKEVQAVQRQIDDVEREQEDFLGKNSTYARDLTELSLVWEMLQKLYEGKGDSYKGTLRRAPSDFFGLRITGGRQLKSPEICLSPSYTGQNMAAHLKGLAGDGAFTMDSQMVKDHAIGLNFQGGKLVYEHDTPYLTAQQRKVLLALVEAEEAAWEKSARDAGTLEAGGGKVLASWRLMRRYVEFLIERIEAQESKKGKSTAEMTAILAETNRRVYELQKTLHGGTFADTIMGGNRTRCFELSPSMIRQFRAFMELLAMSPLAEGIYYFASREGLMVENSPRCRILEGFAYEYTWAYVDGDYPDKWRQEVKGRKLAEVWHRGGDFVKWKDPAKYPAKDIRGNPYQQDGLESRGDRINPKVFFGGTVFERVILRLLDELAREDWGVFQSAMFWGTQSQGNLLRHDNFAEALARKLWEMEKKWGCMSDENRRRWLGAHRGSTRHLSTSGVVANVVRLAAYDKLAL